MTDDVSQPERSTLRTVLMALPLMLFGALAGVIGYVLVDEERDPTALASPMVGRIAPPISSPPLVADIPGLDDHLLATGEPVLINFFASWCAPCRIEHPVLMTMAEEHGVEILGVNYKDPDGRGEAFLAELGNPYTGVGYDLVGNVGIDWGVRGLPETFVIDGDGTIAYHHIGPVLPQQMDEMISLVEDLR